MRLFRLPVISQWVFPQGEFRIRSNKNVVCLSFDDGPYPETTPQVLSILERHHVKAIFFCSGENAEKNVSLVNRILDSGHVVGNHGYKHLNGLTTSCSRYVEDVQKASAYTSAQWFRPPYGRITMRQYAALIKKYRIFFWDLMPYDFDAAFGREKILQLVNRKIRRGSLIVLHDKPSSSVLDVLDDMILNLKAKGFEFVLPECLA